MWLQSIKLHIDNTGMTSWPQEEGRKEGRKGERVGGEDRREPKFQKVVKEKCILLETENNI